LDLFELKNIGITLRSIKVQNKIFLKMNIVITGAARGIGKAIAQEFAKDGNVIFVCARNEATLTETVKDMQTKYANCIVHSFVTDLSTQAGASAFANFCLGIAVPDVLVNNAGGFVPGNILDEEDGSLEKMISNNLYSAYYCTRMLAPAMKQKGSGHIFNICSIAAKKAYDGGGSYSVSKFAMDGFSQNLRNELKNFGVKVTTVFPGAVFTDSWAGFDNSTNRIMEADDIAKMIVAATKLSPSAVVEEILLRPQLGDL
jgi:short-subunit dehydrogenase